MNVGCRMSKFCQSTKYNVPSRSIKYKDTRSKSRESREKEPFAVEFLCACLPQAGLRGFARKKNRDCEVIRDMGFGPSTMYNVPSSANHFKIQQSALGIRYLKKAQSTCLSVTGQVLCTKYLQNAPSDSLDKLGIRILEQFSC